jgi:hypothetical protein
VGVDCESGTNYGCLWQETIATLACSQDNDSYRIAIVAEFYKSEVVAYQMHLPIAFEMGRVPCPAAAASVAASFGSNRTGADTKPFETC